MSIRSKSLALAILAICFMMFSVIAAGCGGGANSNTSNNNNYTPPPPQESVDMGSFQVSNLTFTPDKIFIGETATIGITLYNGGGCDDIQIIKLYIDGVLENQMRVSLEDEQTETIKFDVTKSEYDVYQVDIEGVLGELLIWPLYPVLGEHDEGPFCSQATCHGNATP